MPLVCACGLTAWALPAAPLPMRQGLALGRLVRDPRSWAVRNNHGPNSGHDVCLIFQGGPRFGGDGKAPLRGAPGPWRLSSACFQWPPFRPADHPGPLDVRAQLVVPAGPPQAAAEPQRCRPSRPARFGPFCAGAGRGCGATIDQFEQKRSTPLGRTYYWLAREWLFDLESAQLAGCTGHDECPDPCGRWPPSPPAARTVLAVSVAELALASFPCPLGSRPCHPARGIRSRNAPPKHLNNWLSTVPGANKLRRPTTLLQAADAADADGGRSA